MTNRGRFKLQLILAALVSTLYRPAAAQTPIDNTLFFPVDNYVIEATDADSRICGESTCADMLAVGKFRDGGSDTDPLNVFVMEIDNSGTHKMLNAWTHSSIQYTNNPYIQAGEDFWMVAVQDTVGDGKIYVTCGDTTADSSMYAGTVTLPSDVTALNPTYQFAQTQQDSVDKCEITIMAKKSNLFFVMFVDVKGSTVGAVHYREGAGTSFCLSCALGGGGSKDKNMIYVAGWSEDKNSPAIWTWVRDDPLGAVFVYWESCSFTTSNYVFMAIDGDLVNDELDASEYNFAAIALHQFAAGNVFFYQYFEDEGTDSVMLGEFGGYNVIDQAAKVSTEVGSVTTAYYYISTDIPLALLIQFRYSSTTFTTSAEYVTIVFADNMVNTAIVTTQSLGYNNGYFHWGNFQSFEDINGVVTSTSDSDNGIFIAGVEGYNSNHNYSGFSSVSDYPVDLEPSCTISWKDNDGDLQDQVPSNDQSVSGNVNQPATAFVEDTAWSLSMCISNTVTSLSTQTDINYVVDLSATPEVLSAPTYTTSVQPESSCTITKSLQMYDDGTSSWTSVSVGSPAWIAALDADLALTITTADGTLHGQTVTLKYVISSTESGNSLATAEETFTVNFSYECVDDTITMNIANDMGTESYEIGSGSTVLTSSSTQLYTQCPSTAIVQYYDSTSFSWIDVLDGASPLLNVITIDLTSGDVTVDTSLVSFEPQTQYLMRTVYTSADSTHSDAALIDEWALNIQSVCWLNQMSLSGATTDLTYNIYDSSPPTQTLTVGTTVSKTVASCVLTQTFEIQDSVDLTWSELTTATGAVSVVNYAGTPSIDFSTTDTSFSGLTYDIRLKYTDPNSSDPTATIYDTFAASFVYVCESDDVTSDTITDQNIYLGDSASQITFVESQTEASCATTRVIEAYDQTYQTWVAASTQNWHSAANTAGFIILVDAADYAEYQPSKVITVRATYSSTFSLTASASVTQTFTITFIDACDGNVITVVNSPLDLELRYNIGEDSMESGLSQANFDHSQASCNWVILYEYQEADGSWATYSSAPTGWLFNLSTDTSSASYDYGYTMQYEDPGDLSTFATIRPTFVRNMRLTVNDVIGNSPTVVLTWSVTLIDECSDFQITSNIDPQEDFTFVMGSSSQVDIQYDLNTNYCDTTYSLEFKTAASASYSAYSVAGAEVLKNWDSVGAFSIDADETYTVYPTYSPQQLFYIRVQATNTLSTTGNTYSEDFIVTFVDICASNTVTETQTRFAYTYVSTLVASTVDIFTVPQTDASTSICPLTYEFFSFDSGTGSWLVQDQIDVDNANILDGSISTGQLSTGLVQSDFEAQVPAPYNDFVGEYRWVVSDPRSTAADNSYTTDLTVTYTHGCQGDTITLSSDLQSQTLALLDTYTANVDYLQASSGSCAMTYLYEIYDSGTDSWGPYANSAPHSHFITSYSDSTVTISAADPTTNQQYDQVDIQMRITITIDASQQTTNSVTDTWTMTFVNACRLQTAKTFAVTSPVTTSNAPTSAIIVNSSVVVTWSLLFDVWDSLSLVEQSGCTLTVTLEKDDFSRTEIATYTPSVSLSATAGTVDITSWTDAEYTGIIYVKADITITALNEVVYSTEQPVYVSILDLCLQSQVYTSASLADFEYNLGDPDMSEIFTTHYDSPQQSLGQAICGATQFAIVDASYNPVDSTKIEIVADSQIILKQTSDFNDVTNTDVQYYVKVYLEDYDDISPSTAIFYDPFLVNIKSCLLDSITSDADTTITFNIGSTTAEVSYSEFGQVSNAASLANGQTECGYTLTYTAQWRTYYDTVIDLPSFITWDQTNKKFSIWTDSEADLTTNYQTYDIELTGSTQTIDQDPPAIKTQTFTFSVTNLCTTDEVSVTSTVWSSNMIYYLGGETTAPSFIELGGASNTIQLTADWDSTVAGCPWTLKMQIYDADQVAWRDLSVAEQAIVNWTQNVAYSSVSGTVYPATDHMSVTIISTDLTMDQTSWQLRAYRHSTLSTSTSTAGFIETVVEWRHVCWDMLKIPAIPNTTMIATLFNTGEAISWVGAADSTWTDTDLCGPYTYTFQLDSANGSFDLPADTSDFETFLVISGVNVFHNFADTKYSNLQSNTGEYMVSLVSTYGIYGDASQQFTLIINNPCNTPTWQVTGDAYTSSGPFDSSDPLLALLEVQGEATIFTFVYPQLLESATYGTNAYSLCGERTVYLEEKSKALFTVDATGIPPYTAPYVSLSANLTPNDFSQRSYTVTFQSTSDLDYGLHELVFKQGLDDYPDAAPWEFDISVRIDPCVVTSFTAPSDLDVTYTIGDPLQTIQYVFDQYPCSYAATYNVTYADDSSDELPDYMQFSSTSGVLTVYSTDREDIGTISVNVNATLANLELFESELFSYTVDPDNPPSDFIYTAGFTVNITLHDPGNSYETPENTAPYLVPKPSQLTAYIGKSFSHSFGESYDIEGDNVVVKMDLGTAAVFAKFDGISSTLTIAEGATSLSDSRLNKIQLILTDDNSDGSMQTTYTITLALEELSVDSSSSGGQGSLGDGLVNFHGVVASPAEIFQNITTLQEQFQKRIYDVRETTKADILSNQIDSTDFATVDLFEGTPFEVLMLEDSKEESIKKKEKKKSQLPVPKIESLSSDGLLTIRFNEKMKVPERYRDIEDSEVALRWLETQGNVDGKNETFLIGEGFRDFEIRPALDLQVVPSGEDVEPKDVAFTWEVVSFKENEVKIQLFFVTPEKLSADPLNTDNMLVTFWANDFFVSESGYEMLQGQTLQVRVIRQIDSAKADRYKNNAKIFGFGVLICLIAGFILAFILGADTLPIWALYDTLLLIGHLPLINVNMSGATVIFLTTMTKTLSFSFFDLGSPLIDLLNKDAENENLGVLFFQSGYESVFVLVNLARTIFAIAILVLFGSCASQLNKYKMCRWGKPRPNGRTVVQQNTWNDVMYNLVFRTLLCIYLTVSVAIFINLKTQKLNEEGVFMRCSLFATVFFLVVMCGYVFALLFVGVNESLKEKPEKAPSLSYATVFLGLKWNGKPNSFFYIIYFMMRRICFAIVAVLLQDYPMHQIFSLILMSSIMLLLLQKLKPYEMRHNQHLQMLNEFFFFSSCMVMLIFTPAFSIDPMQKEQIGYLIPYIVLIAISVNLLMQVHAIWWQLMFNRRQRLNQQQKGLSMKNFAIKMALTKSEPEVVEIPAPIKPAIQGQMEQISEESEEDSENVSYNPRRHQNKREMFKNGKVTPNEPHLTSVSVTNMNDLTADNMVMGDDSMLGGAENMLRAPGPPIGYANMQSAMPLNRSPDVTGRSTQKLISGRSAIDLDNERVNDQNISLNVFNINVEKMPRDDQSSLSHYHRQANSPPRIRSSETKKSPKRQDPLDELVDDEIQREIDNHKSVALENESSTSEEDENQVQVMTRVQRANLNRYGTKSYKGGSSTHNMSERGPDQF